MTSPGPAQSTWTVSSTMRRVRDQLFGARRGRELRGKLHRHDRPTGDGLLRPDVLKLLLLHGLAVRGIRPLVLSSGEQKHRESYCGLHGRQYTGTCKRSWRRRQAWTAGYSEHLSGTGSSERNMEDLLHGDAGFLPFRG